jgi:outer membrane autotransporter protein
MISVRLKKAVLLGLVFSVTRTAFAAPSGQLMPGDVTTEHATITRRSPLIDRAGTYNIKTPSGAIEVTGIESHAGLINGSSAGDITVNGDIRFSSRDVLSHYLIQGEGGKTITLNGNLTVDSHNGTKLNVPPEWAPRGIQIMENRPSGTKIIINGDVDYTVYNDMDPDGADDSYTVAAVMSPGTEISFNGNVRIVNTVDHYDRGYGGANAVYAEHNSTLNIKGDQVILQTISWRPHAISAKDGATVNIDAKKLQVVGCIDMTEDANPSIAKGGTLNTVFSGTDSYWYGDEINVNGTGNLNVTFRDGAMYIPFGTVREVGYAPTYYPVNPYGAKKYISQMNLESGGIINLFDADAQSHWESLGLDSRYTALKSSRLDYLMIGDLKGSNGVFRLDMNDLDKAHTDMIYILDSTSGSGLHHIEAYNDNNFGEVSENKTLRFATVAAAAADKLIFRDKMNIYGNSLWDYQVLIGHAPYDVNDPENALYNSERDGLTAEQINQLMAGGMNWFIYGMSRMPTDDARVVIDGVNAGYDVGTSLDRYNKRHGEARFLNPDSNVWVRLQRGAMGRDSGYDGMYTMGQIGLEFGKNHHHYGLGADYLKGTSDLSRHNGTVDTARRGIMAYDTLTWDNGAYLDTVARYGRVETDLDGYNSRSGQEISGNASQATYGISLEYGQKMPLSREGLFLEPQAQLQYMHLKGDSYRTSNGFDVNMDNADSFIGRLGFRLGQEWADKGSVYLKADVLREFTGGQDFTLRASDSTMQDSVSKRGTWYDVGLGVDFNMAPNAVFTFDLERSFGGELGKNWEFNMGARWKL